jgi:hypothetical protein
MCAVLAGPFGPISPVPVTEASNLLQSSPPSTVIEPAVVSIMIFMLSASLSAGPGAIAGHFKIVRKKHGFM